MDTRAERVLVMAENSFTNKLAGSITEEKMCSELSTALSAFPFESGVKKFTVRVANHDYSERFFGMRVFPDIEQLDEFCREVVDASSSNRVKYTDIVRRWKTIKSWYVEIDATCFDVTRIAFNAKELTAIILHEIGHVIYSDKPVEGFYRAYQEVRLRLKSSDKASEKMMYNIYMIPLTLACMQRRWVTGKNQIKSEMIADQSVIELGYGPSLVNAFNKIIRMMGTIQKDSNQLQKELDQSMLWCQQIIVDVMKRKEHLKDQLYYQAIKTKSNYFKAITIIILDKLGFRMRERYTGAVVENTIELLSKKNLTESYEPIVYAPESAKFDSALIRMQSTMAPAMESLFNHRKKVKVVLPSQFEIDSIAIEVDKISNHYDRTFVLDLIYEVLERINNFEEVISQDPALVRKWEGKIADMKSQLTILRKQVLEKKSFPSNSKYKFFVKLDPVAADYEG